MSPTPITDIIIDIIETKEREGEREYESEYGAAAAATTKSVLLKFYEKEREGGFDKGAAPIPQYWIYWDIYLVDYLDFYLIYVHHYLVLIHKQLLDYMVVYLQDYLLHFINCYWIVWWIKGTYNCTTYWC